MKGDLTMFIKEMTYTDFDGTERTEKFYFNLTKAEIMEMELSTAGGLQQILKDIIASKDVPKMIEMFKKIILASYGEKSADGKRFIKSKEITDAFTQTNAYSDLFIELATDDVAAAEFVNHIIPKEAQLSEEETKKLIEENK